MKENRSQMQSDLKEKKIKKLWKNYRDNGILAIIIILIMLVLLFDTFIASFDLLAIFITALLSSILMAIGCAKNHELGAWAGIVFSVCLMLFLGLIGVLIGALMIVDMIELLVSFKKK